MHFISFIIPAFNEAEHLPSVIQAIKSQNVFSKNQFEIIVIDNASTDQTPDIAKKLGAHVSTIKKSTVAAARNKGATLAKGDVYCFVDGDTVLTPIWFSALYELLDSDSTPINFVTGSHVIIPPNSSWVERNWFSGEKSNNYIGSANIICSSSAFQSVNGFDELKRTGEDYDFCSRVKEMGIYLASNPKFEAIHLGYPKCLKSFTKREIWHGIGDVQSFHLFFSSKVSVLAQLYLILVVLIFLLAVSGYYAVSITTCLTLVFLNTLITVKLRNVNSLENFVANGFLNFFYFIGHALSPLYLLNDTIKEKRSN